MVNLVHRHHSAPVGHKFSFGVFAGSDLVGVAICGRPVARMLDDGKTLEVTRTATVGYKNSISKVLAAARKEALAHGFTRSCRQPSDRGKTSMGMACAQSTDFYENYQQRSP